MAFLLGFSVVVALILATASLYRYGNVQRQHPIVTLSVLTAWSFSFLIVFTIPLDVTSVSLVWPRTKDWISIFWFSLRFHSRPFTGSASTNTIKRHSSSIASRTQAKNANSHGAWYPNTYFRICGASFTGHPNFWHGWLCRSCNLTSKLETLPSRANWRQL